MTASSFDAALARVLAHEGGYSNHPSDPGGPTNFGITIADYRRYVKADATAADVRAMRLDQAGAIYKAHYWDAMRCDDLPAGLDYAIFDYGVNSGIGRAVRVLRRLLGMADAGGMTEALLVAIRKRETALLVARLCDERLAFLKRLKTWPVFGAGWGRRVAEVRSVALAMARVEKGQATAVPKTDAPAKGRAQGGVAAAIAAAGAAIAHAAHQAGAPATAFIIVLAVVTLGFCGWLVWRWRRGRPAPVDSTKGDQP